MEEYFLHYILLTKDLPFEWAIIQQRRLTKRRELPMTETVDAVVGAALPP